VVNLEGNFHGIVRLLVVAFSAFQLFSFSLSPTCISRATTTCGGRTSKADVDVCFTP
jgi:hypothetical protein